MASLEHQSAGLTSEVPSKLGCTRQACWGECTKEKTFNAHFNFSMTLKMGQMAQGTLLFKPGRSCFSKGRGATLAQVHLVRCLKGIVATIPSPKQPLVVVLLQVTSSQVIDKSASPMRRRKQPREQSRLSLSMLGNQVLPRPDSNSVRCSLGRHLLGSTPGRQDLRKLRHS